MKDVVLMFQSFEAVILPKIDYVYSDSKDVYIVSSLASFKEYFTNLIVNNKGNPVKVICEFRSKADYMKLLHFLKKVERQIDTSVSSPEEVHANPKFDLVTIYWDDKQVDKLSVHNIYNQQFLRTIMLSLRGSFIYLDKELWNSENEHTFYTIESVEALLRKIHPSPGASHAVPVYDSKSPIRILVPQDWDSWSKIRLLASSTIFPEKNVQLLKDDADFEAVLEAFNGEQSELDGEIASQKDTPSSSNKEVADGYQNLLQELVT